MNFLSLTHIDIVMTHCMAWCGNRTHAHTRREFESQQTPHSHVGCILSRQIGASGDRENNANDITLRPYISWQSIGHIYGNV